MSDATSTVYVLRYYAPHYVLTTDSDIRALLAEVQARHGVGSEVKEMPSRPGSEPDTPVVDQDAARAVYQRDFRPRASVLRQRTGESIRRLLRSKSGHYYIAGTVAVTKDDQVEWIASHATPFKEFDEDPTLGFLKAALQHGPGLLAQLTPPIVRGTPELTILDAFIASRVITGKPAREVKVGTRRRRIDGTEFDWRKSIDLVYANDQDTWLLEGKTRLNYEALGEILTYGLLYAREYGGLPKLGIVAGSIDEEIAEACQEYKVAVFHVTGKSVAQVC